MIKKIILAAVAVGMFGASIAPMAAEAPAQNAAPVQAPSLNPMDPATVSGFMNPQTHQQYHQALMNPAQWAQFTQPQYYMQMANPALMMQWMNPASYQMMMNPYTYMYWMQPNAMMGEMAAINPAVFMNPGSYQAFMNPNTYMAWMNPAVYTAAAQQMSVPGYGRNAFNMDAWSNFFQPAPQPAPQAEAGKE